MKLGKIFVVVVLTVALLSFGACAKAPAVKEETAKVETKQETKEEALTISGKLTLGGSTSVEKVALALGDEFVALNPDVDFSYDSTGSSAGVTAAGSKTVMIGAASRNIKDKEKEEFKLDEQVLCFDGIAVVVHPSNGLKELSMEQVQKIFMGEITNWAEVGGDDMSIVVVSREDGSGTRGAFEDIVDFEDVLTGTATIADGNGNVASTVAGEEQAIGYVSFVTLEENDDVIKGLLVDGGYPKAEEVAAGSYPISRPFNFIYYQAELPEVAVAFLDFVMTADASAIIESKGAIPVE